MVSLFPEATSYELTHSSTKEATGLILKILPADHDDVYNAGIEVVKSLRHKGALTAIDVAVSLENRINVAAACIADWEVKDERWTEVFKAMGFEDASFTHEKAVALLSRKDASWIRSQIEGVISDKERFFAPASNS